MKNILRKLTRYTLLGLMALLFLSSCKAKHSTNTKAGIVLSFDDKSIDDWYSLRELFKGNGVRATFFVCNFQDLTDKEVSMLKDLQADGHEIGSHS